MSGKRYAEENCMIIVLSPSDGEIVAAAQQRSFNFPEIFGRTYILGQGEIPMLGENESLFFTGHALIDGDSGNPEIGEESGALAMDGLELWDNFKHIFPDQYQGNVLIDACESNDHPADGFSIAEAFRSQSDLVLDSSAVFGRTGSPPAADPIPFPGDPQWSRADGRGI